MSSFEDFEKATENLAAIVMEGDDGASEVSVDLEVRVAEEVTEPIEEAAVEEEAVEDTTEAVDEMLAQYEKMEHNMAVVEKYGWSAALAAIIDPTGVMQRINPAMPGMESLDVAGSPSSNETMIALETFKETMGKFWQWIKDTCKKIWEQITSFFRTVVNLFTSYETQAKRLAAAISKASFGGFDAKAKDKDVSVMTKSDWQTVKTALIATAGKLIGEMASVKSANIRGYSSTLNMAGMGVSSVGLSAGEGSVAVSGDFMKKLQGSEGKLSTKGWTPGDFKAGAISDLVAIVKSKLPSVGKDIEAGSKKLAAEAAKAATDDTAKEEMKKGAKLLLKNLNTGTRIAQHLVKVGGKLCKAYMKAGYAVYSCKGDAAAAKKD